MTTDLATVANSSFDDVPSSFELPDGEYLFEVVRSKIDATQDGKAHIALTLRPVEDLSGALSTDELQNAYNVRDRLWLHSAGGEKMTKSFFENIAKVDTTGHTKAEVAEAVIGTVVRAAVKANQAANGRSYINVDGYLRQ